MAAHLAHVISFVDDLDAAVAFYRDVIGLSLRLHTPHWVEFETGATTLALHPATADAPSGTVKIGLGLPELETISRQLAARSESFTRKPEVLHGVRLAEFRGPGGAPVSVSAPV